MKFSIIIPAYNIAKYIEECAGSVLNQQTNGQFQFEIILVNDGSTDETGVICDRLAKQHSHIKTIHQANQGLSGARNTGIDVAEGDFLLFLDGDDFWTDKGFLKKIYDLVKDSNVDLVIYSYSAFFANKTVPNPFSWETSEILMEENVDKLVSTRVYTVSAWTKCVRSEIIRKNNIRFEVGRLSEDCYWSIELLKVSETFKVLNSSQYMYRQNRKGSITETIKEKNIVDILESVEVGLRDLRAYSDVRRNALRMLLAYYYLATLPSIYKYYGNEKVKKLVEEQKCLVDDIFQVESRQLQWRGRLIKWFGVLPSSYLLSRIKIMRNIFRKLDGNLQEKKNGKKQTD